MSVDISFKPKTKRRFADSPAIRAKRKASLEARIAAYRKAHYRCSDAGRSAWSKATGIRETRDCTVRALATAANVSYSQAYSLLADMGRKPRRGFHMATAVDRLTEHDCGPTPTNVSGQVWRVVPGLGQGRWIVSIRGHVFAVVDGVAVDEGDFSRKRVLAAWRIHGLKPEYAQTAAAAPCESALAAG